jgi:hypothetical protein
MEGALISCLNIGDGKIEYTIAAWNLFRRDILKHAQGERQAHCPGSCIDLVQKGYSETMGSISGARARE